MRSDTTQNKPSLNQLRAERDAAAKRGDHGEALVLNDRIIDLKNDMERNVARPLGKTYDAANPFVVERHDQEDGSIVYEIWDHRPDTYRRLCVCAEDYNDEADSDIEDKPTRGQTKIDADMIATALNMIYGKRQFKSAKLRAIPHR